MTITLTPENEAKLIRFATSRGLAPEEALDELLDGIEPEPVRISKELADELDTMLEGIEAGTVAFSPWDSGARRKRTAELLKREFGDDSNDGTEKAVA